ncbi:uncharacterized protein RB166_015355 [Leptodactylus fuscus]|uniref:uncharacterized protein LOC142216754 n=1 Tax=Leptodactylus fuscus TaxID=238119 RepID=UPI003F4EDFCD
MKPSILMRDSIDSDPPAYKKGFQIVTILCGMGHQLVSSGPVSVELTLYWNYFYLLPPIPVCIQFQQYGGTVRSPVQGKKVSCYFYYGTKVICRHIIRCKEYKEIEEIYSNNCSVNPQENDEWEKRVVQSIDGSHIPPAMNDAERRRKIRDFTFDKCKRGNQGFDRILLQLFGYVGHGKSSFINSAMCVWSNSEYENLAKAANTDESHTTQRFTFRLTEKIVMVDNRGCSSLNTYETGEIFAQLANLLPVDKPVGWSKGFKLVDRIVEAEPYVKASDFIIPIFVYSVTNLPPPGLKEELKAIFNTATELTKVVPIVVLTHKNDKNYTEVSNMFRDIGVERMINLENYTQENRKRKKETDEQIIQFLYEVISDAQFHADHPRNADQEMIDRKKFVVKYIHDRELMVQAESLRRQTDLKRIEIEKASRKIQEEEEYKQQMNRQFYEERMERLRNEFERQLLEDEFEYAVKHGIQINRNKYQEK